MPIPSESILLSDVTDRWIRVILLDDTEYAEVR
jgi:hypothetical protein